MFRALVPPLTVLLVGAGAPAVAQQAATAVTYDAAAAITAYRERIAARSGRSAAEDRALIEDYVGLAFAQRRSGDHGAAATSFAQAIYLERMHRGLDHPDQIPLIERLVESNRARGAWREVAANLKLLGWVNRRGREPADPAALATVERLAEWHLEASRHDSGSDPYTHLSAALKAVDAALAALPGGSDPRDAALGRLLPLKAALSHAAAEHVSSVLVSAATPVRHRRLSGVVSADLDEVLYRQNLIARHYAAGREALEQARAAAAARGDDGATARAVQLLGDWHQLFGRVQSAAAHYAEARSLGARAGIDLFAEPRRLPDFLGRRAAQPGPTAGTAQVDYVRTRFDVDEHGRAHNITIIETNPPHAHALARRVRQQLRHTRYRPRFDGGRAVATSGVEIRFVFPPAPPSRGATL